MPGSQPAVKSHNEAAVVITITAETETPETLLGDAHSVLEFFMLSSLTVERGDETSAAVTKSGHEKCPRCWRHVPDFGDEVCERCETAMA